MIMKKKHIIFPLVFLVFGTVVIATVSGLSIKRYIRQNEFKNISAKNNVTEKNVQAEKGKLFFQAPKQKPEKTSIKIYKEKRVMELYGDNELIGRFKVGLGRVPSGKKEKEGDLKTPEGTYYICYTNPKSKYDYFFGISYPNIDDAKEALNKKVIGKINYDRIEWAINNKEQPPWNTSLGGEIGIHGGGSKYDWTYGCIALSNKDMDILKKYVGLKTTVEIYQ